MKQGVTFVVESMGGGGAQQVIAHLIRHWSARGVEVALITFQGQEEDKVELPKEITRVILDGQGAMKSSNAFQAIFFNLRRLWKLRRAVNLLEHHTVFPFVGTTLVLTILALFMSGKRVVACERNDPGRQSLGKSWNVMRWLVTRFAWKVTANSRGALESMSGWVPASKLVWVPNPIRRDNSRMKYVSDRPFVLAVGRLNKQKAYDVLLEAFAEFLTANAEWNLVILGEGPEYSHLQRLICDFGLEDCVFMHGYKDPFAYYRTAQMMVQASRYEGLPNTVLEAMSCACPVIVTDSQTGLKGIVTDRRTGLVVPANDVAALAEAMKSLASRSGLAQEIGQAGCAEVAVFSDGHVMEIWDQLITVGPQVEE
ncbi:glycosyltransferase [Thalassospira lucentensis]|uniref:glycosyltransferase n=1 Tax=Thalassospira lucentensis TaxID=168935 RepID=UPI003D2F1D47